MESVFVSRVAEGRGVSTAKVIKDFGQGAVMVSSDAKDAGMIDGLVSPRGIPAAVVPALPDPFSRRTVAVSTGLAAETETPAEPAATPETGRKTMTLKELLASDATALAEYNAAMKAQFDAGKAEMQAVAKKVGAYLTSDVYSKSKAIVERALKAMSGEGTAEAVEAMVSMFDLMAEDKKQALASAETEEQGETPAQKHEAEAMIIARAQELKIDVEKVNAAAKAQGLDPMKALEAEIELQVQIAREKEMGA